MGRPEGFIYGKDGQARFRNSRKIVKSRIKAEILYAWKPVRSDVNNFYYFPDEITPYMKDNYRNPQVYRWNIYKNRSEDKRIVYIGETKELCPNRIKNVLKPGPSQKTNQRLNNEFKKYCLENNYHIRLEVCSIDKMNLGNRVICQEDLNRDFIRKLIEAMLIEHYQQKGFRLLNIYGNEDGSE